MTPKILKILNKHGAKATFFLIGKNIISNEELVRKISNEGHSIGNHTYYHRTNFPISNKSKITKDLEKTNKILERITLKNSENCVIFDGLAIRKTVDLNVARLAL